MNIGLLGGTFDPIHNGHLALARAASARFSLNRVLFVPANIPPHKQKHALTPFIHRYSMVALATRGDKSFQPSLLEAPEFNLAQTSSSLKRHEAAVNYSINYSIDTVRKLKASLKKSDNLYFLIGIDAFMDISKWREATAILSECAFVVASRPGYSLREVAESLPEGVRPAAPVTLPFHKQPAAGDLVLPGARVHLLEDVHYRVSATSIRAAASAGKPLARWVDPNVADYIRKLNLYRGK